MPTRTAAKTVVLRLPAFRVMVLSLLLLGGSRFNAAAYIAADAQTMISGFNDAFYFTASGNRGYFRNTTAGGTTWFWGRANQMEMLIDLYEQSSNTVYLTQFQQLYNGFVSDFGTSWIWNEFNDDIMWMVIACSRAYQHTGNTTYRNVAKSNFDSCYARAWSSDLGGGLWWKSPLNTSKNACVNGPGAIAAYLIYQNYNDTNYLNIAESLYQWERMHLFETNTGRVYDSYNISGNKDTTPITYNSGTFIGAANFLGYTNDAILAASYVKNSMGSGGQFPNYDEHNDLGGFNGIFVRWMVKFMNERGLQSSYQLWLQQNANAAWNVRRAADNLSWSKWWDQTPDGQRWSFGCWGSVLIVNLVPPTQNPGGPVVFLNASDANNTSSFNSGLNWSGGQIPSWTNHYVVADARTLRTPPDSSHHSFAGSSLTLSNGGVLAFKNTTGSRFVSIGTDLFLDDGEVANWAGNSAHLGGKITLRSGGGKIDPQGNSFTVPALIGGPGFLRIGAGASSPLNGTVIISGVNTYTGGTIIEATHTVQINHVGTLGSQSGSLTFINAGRGYGSLNLNGTNLTVGNFNGLGGAIRNNKSASTSVLTIGQGGGGGGDFKGAILNAAGAISLVKTGAGLITLSGANTYTGPTTIAEGVLVFGFGASGQSASLNVSNGATGQIGTSTPLLSGTKIVALATGGQLNLATGINQSVGYLICNGTIQPAGTWGATGSPAANQDDSYFGGAGVLTVASSLAAPNLLSATPGNGVVNLSWASVAGATSFHVKRAPTPGGPFTMIAANVLAINHSDVTASNGVTYHYVITAVNALGESVTSNELAATPVGPPSPPTGLFAIAGTNEVSLGWATVPGATGYQIKRAGSGGGAYTMVGTSATNAFTDTGLVNGTIYYYVVSATNTVGESGNSVEVNAKPGIRNIVTLLAGDANNATSFNAAGNWDNFATPNLTNDYVVGTNFVLRTPTSGSHTFAGNTLTLISNSIFAFKTGGTVTVGTNFARALTLDGGWVGLWIGGQATLGGFVNLESGGGGFDPQANSPLVISAQISGPGFLKLDTAPGNAATGGTLVLNAVNSYTGGTVIDANMTLRLANAGTLGAANGSLAIINTNGRSFGTLDLNGTSQSIGNLSGTGGRILNQLTNTTSTLTIGHGDANGGVFLGAISNGVGTVALQKVGAGTIALAGSNTWTGGTTIAGGAMQLGDGTTRNSSVIGNVTNHATLIIANPLAQIFTNVVSGAGTLIKAGAGRLTLTSANAYAGKTTISAGTLELLDFADISSSAEVHVFVGATLDVASRVDRKFVLNNSRTFTGSGNILGSLDALVGSVVSPGSGVGALTISEAATLAGTVRMELNRGAVPNCDRLNVAGSIVANGTLTVTNLGAALQAGDSFQILNKAVTGFVAVNLPELESGLMWTNRLADDGTLQVVASVSPVPTNIVMQVNGAHLELSWPVSHTGWRLQVQTNNLNVGLGPNWFEILGAAATNQWTLPLDPDNEAVFFRLIYP
jgi:autotransporter-associated beta strand protein